MALLTTSLLLSLLVTATPVAGSSEKIAPRTGTSLIKCYDAAPALTNASSRAFRASLHRLLRTLPSAAAPTGFASVSSTGRRHRAFARALCFGESTAPSECLGCLSVAARNLASGCGATTRRAGIWTDRCFMAYADTDCSTPSEDAFRSRVLLGGHVAVPVPADATNLNYSGCQHAEAVTWAQLVAEGAAFKVSAPRMVATADETSDADWPMTLRSTAHVLAQCARDRTEVECSLCLFDSARAVDWDLDAARGDGGVAAAVLGFHCYLGFEVSSSPVSENVDMFAYCVTGGLVAALALFVPLALAVLWNLQ